MIKGMPSYCTSADMTKSNTLPLSNTAQTLSDSSDTKRDTGVVVCLYTTSPRNIRYHLTTD